MTDETLDAEYALDLEFCRKVADVPPLLDERLSLVKKFSIASPEIAIKYLLALECAYASAFQSAPILLLLWLPDAEGEETGLSQIPYKQIRRRCFWY